MTDAAQPQSAATDAPAAEVRTFLIADVRGYTRFTVEHGDEAAARLAVRFADLAEETIAARDGRVLELRGDEALAVFASPRQALRAAAELQERVAREAEGPPFEIGIGLDAGEAVPVKGGFRGAALNLAARLCSLAGRGEVLASEALVHLARKIEGLEYAERGFVQLKGFAEPVQVIEVRQARDGDAPEAPAEQPAEGRVEQRLPIGGFLGSLPSGALIGREADLGAALAAVDAVVGGDGRLVMLAGEPGVGKTRLAQEITLAIHDRGFLLGAGSCYEPERATPFYPFLEALGAIHDAAPPSVRARVPKHWPHLGRLLPNASMDVPPGSGSAQEEQQRLFWAVTGVLQAIAEQVPVALLLDDLHWADGSTLSLLQHLARHTRSHRVLLLGTYRDVEIGRHHPLEGVLLDLGRQGLLQRIAVRRLAVEGTAGLMAAELGVGEVSREFAALLHAHTEGNPFFVGEVLRALVERGDVYQENGRWTRRALEQIEVPESVRSVIGQRLSHLREETQALLHEASVLGQTFTFDDLQSLDGRSETEIERALEEAVAAGLARETGRDTYAFNHALTQGALYAELSSRRRRKLHLAAGEALERLPERVRERRLAELARHFGEADDPERALLYTMQVGDRAAAAFAHDDASRAYHAALELAREAGDEAREAEAYEKLGGLLTATIRYREALEMLEPAARLFGAVRDRESEGRVVAQIGRVYYSMAMTEDGIARLEPALATLQGEGSPRALAGLTSVLGKLYFSRARYEEALAAAERGAELARATSEGGVLAESAITRGSSLVMLGRWREGLQVLEDAVPLAESVSDIFSVCRALQSAAAVYLVRGELERHRAAMEQALEVAERMRNQRQVAATTFGLCINAFVAGDWARAHIYADRVLEVMTALGSTWRSAFHLVGLAALALAEGQSDRAERYLEECLAISGPTGDAQTYGGAQEILAQKDLQEGRYEAARARLESILDEGGVVRGPAGTVTAVGIPLPGHYVLAGTHHTFGLLPLLGWVYVEMGDTARAQALADAGIEGAAEAGLRLALLEWNGIKGASLAHEGRWTEAAAALDGALDLARRIPYPYAEGRMLYEYGRMLAARGEPEQARERLERALAIFRRLGARPYAERAEALLG